MLAHAKKKYNNQYNNKNEIEVKNKLTFQQSIGLAFIAYPEATISMDLPPLWSFLFFFMLINLALSSICSGVQTFIAFILDERPDWTRVILFFCG